MLENTEHLRDLAGELKELKKSKHKAKLWIFSASWTPEDIIELMKDFRNYQNNILNK